MAERLEEILGYYREKSDKIEAERIEWLQQLNYMKQSKCLKFNPSFPVLYLIKS